MASHIKELHSQVRKKLDESNKKYKLAADKHRRSSEFQEGDLVWVNLSKERFPRGKFGKLQDRAYGPCRILKRLGANAYQIELPADMEVSTTFNEADLQPYYADVKEQDFDSMTSHFQPGGTDE
ncbi:hypothetical protein TB2_035161 [Malus domestica]